MFSRVRGFTDKPNKIAFESEFKSNVIHGNLRDFNWKMHNTANAVSWAVGARGRSAPVSGCDAPAGESNPYRLDVIIIDDALNHRVIHVLFS